jgi:outer membrane lipoprotein SlyB
MKRILALVAAASTAGALAQLVTAPQASCADCGTVTMVRPVTQELRPRPIEEGEPSGFVATVPLGGGKLTTGSSSRIGKDAPNVSTRWEVAVRMDDGRYRILTLDARPPFDRGERVRVREGKLERPPEK